MHLIKKSMLSLAALATANSISTSPTTFAAARLLKGICVSKSQKNVINNQMSTTIDPQILAQLVDAKIAELEQQKAAGQTADKEAAEEVARVAAEEEAAEEAARVAAEKEAARVAAEKEAARVAAEKEAAEVAARLVAEIEAAEEALDTDLRRIDQDTSTSPDALTSKEKKNERRRYFLREFHWKMSELLSGIVMRQGCVTLQESVENHMREIADDMYQEIKTDIANNDYIRGNWRSGRNQGRSATLDQQISSKYRLEWGLRTKGVEHLTKDLHSRRFGSDEVCKATLNRLVETYTKKTELAETLNEKPYYGLAELAETVLKVYADTTSQIVDINKIIERVNIAKFECKDYGSPSKRHQVNPSKFTTNGSHIKWNRNKIFMMYNSNNEAVWSSYRALKLQDFTVESFDFSTDETEYCAKICSKDDPTAQITARPGREVNKEGNKHLGSKDLTCRVLKFDSDKIRDRFVLEFRIGSSKRSLEQEDLFKNGRLYRK